MPIERLPTARSAERVSESLAREGCAGVERLVRAASMRAVLGDRRGAYALGYVDDVRNPLEVLRGASAAGSDAGRLCELDCAAAQLRRAR